MKKLILVFILLLFACTSVNAREVVVTMFKLKGDGLDNTIGVVVAKDTARGLELTPHLRGLSPGSYQFNVHDSFGCGSQYNPDGTTVMGMAAGDIFKPVAKIEVGVNGQILEPMRIENLSVRDLSRRSFVISRYKPGIFATSANEVRDAKRVACGSLEDY